MKKRLYLRMKLRQFWAVASLVVLVIIASAPMTRSVLGWELGAAFSYLHWLGTGVSEVQSGIVGWKWGEVGLPTVNL